MAEKKRVTKFLQLQKKVQDLGGRLTKEWRMITPWGWRKIRYNLYHTLWGSMSYDTLKEMEREVNDMEKYLARKNHTN